MEQATPWMRNKYSLGQDSALLPFIREARRFTANASDSRRLSSPDTLRGRAEDDDTDRKQGTIVETEELHS